MRAFELEHREFRRLHRRAKRAQQADCVEVVGLLAIDERRPSSLRLVFLSNAATKPGSWAIVPTVLSGAMRVATQRGLVVVGLFHSHPLSTAVLGVRDRKSTPSGWLHMVHDVCALEPRLFRVRRRHGREEITELELQVARSPTRSRAAKGRAV